MADHLGDASKCNQACESPLLPSVALVDVDEHADAEHGDEDGVCYQIGSVLEDAPFDRACLEGALAPASLLRFVGRHCSLFVKVLPRSIVKSCGCGGVGLLRAMSVDDSLIDVFVLC